jgi:hypothetical protein
MIEPQDYVNRSWSQASRLKLKKSLWLTSKKRLSQRKHWRDWGDQRGVKSYYCTIINIVLDRTEELALMG